MHHTYNKFKFFFVHTAPTAFVATTGIPVPAQSSISTSPIFTGAEHEAALTAAITSNILSFGTGDFVLQLTLSDTPPVTLIVVVTVLTGDVTSARAYISPRLQVLPLTSTTSVPSMETVILQPIGQFMHVSSLISISVLRYLYKNITGRRDEIGLFQDNLFHLSGSNYLFFSVNDTVTIDHNIDVRVLIDIA